MKNLYKGVDLYVNSSRHEALSFLIIEAMAAGLPCVITNMAGNPDILTGPDRGGLLVTYDDPDSMAQALKTMMTDRALLETCKKNALENVKTRFNIQNLAGETYRVYEKAVGR